MYNVRQGERSPMKRWVLKLILLIILALIPASIPAEKLAPASQFLQLIGDPEVKRVQEVAFVVKAKHPGSERFGTGIAVAQGLVLTAFHLVGSPDTGEITAEEIMLSQPHMGRFVYAVGHEFFPGGIGVIYPRDGKILGGLKENAFFAIFPPVARGFSGGGVFNKKHELVGIVSRNFIFLRTLENGKQIVIYGTMAVKINHALQLMGDSH